ncbi:MAG TPA: 2-amino-4-hydroxy-6-hydroxymethyldihydropteridine diphosphokinase [Xanthobacteraceae bacterium]
MAEALIALGGNLGDTRATLDRAVAMLCDGDAVTLLLRSSDYRTPPWGVENQPPFINLCLVVATVLSPRELLARAQRIERALGRDRANELRWGPRTVDIDLLAYDDVVLNDPDLVLPHPRLKERAFVLVPLAEIAPDRVIAGTRVRDAVARLDTSGIERLPPRQAPAVLG